MDLKDYVGILGRRKWIVLVTVLAALAIAIVGTGLIKPAYQASTTVRVAAAASGPLNYTASTYSNQLINTAAQIASSRPMLDKVMSELKLTQEPLITSVVLPDTELIKITVEYSNPKMAAQIANTLAGMLVAQSNELYTGGKLTSQDVLAKQLSDYQAELELSRKEYEQALAITPPAPERITTARDLLEIKQRNYDALVIQYNDALLQQQVRSGMTTVVEPATVPTSPIRPQRTYNYLMGLAVGLFVGVVLAFVVDNFDPTLHGAHDVELAAALPILARIPKAARSNVRMVANDQGPLPEAFRNLALSVLQPGQEQAGKVLLVLSGEAQQGKSTVAANLVTALAEYGRNVVAIDCDMRRPQLHEMFGLENQSGLRNVLDGSSDIKTELRHLSDCVSVVTSGGQAANPSQLLGSPLMAKLVNDLSQQFDFVVLDTPALLAVSDASTVAQNLKLGENANTVLLVVRQGQAQRDAVRSAGRIIERLPHRAAGIVLNQADPSAESSYYPAAKA